MAVLALNRHKLQLQQIENMNTLPNILRRNPATIKVGRCKFWIQYKMFVFEKKIVAV